MARLSGREIDRMIAAYAQEQDGLVTRSQLGERGVSRESIRVRIASRRLHPVFSGVLAVGHTVVTRRGIARAALLSYGAEAQISHLWGAGVFGLWKDLPRDVDVSAPRGGKGPQDGVNLHELLSPLHRDDWTRRHGIVVTTPPRICLDLADEHERRVVERVFDEAMALRHMNERQVRAILDRSPGRRGIPLLHEILERDYTARTKEKFEEKMRLLLDQTDLPKAHSNYKIGRWEVDLYWPDARFGLELDSRTWHSTARTQKRDRDKDRELDALGIDIRRVRWWEVTDEPLALLTDLAITIAERARLAV